MGDRPRGNTGRILSDDGNRAIAVAEGGISPMAGRPLGNTMEDVNSGPAADPV